MKLFLPVRGFQDCMKIQSNLNKLSKWCERNSLFLNVDKCKTITYSRTRYPVEFAYMLTGSGKLYKRSRVHHGREDELFGACEFIRRLSLEFRDQYTLKSLYSTRPWFVRSWNTPAVYGAHFMTCIRVA
jgi:hypothetical protein